MTHKYSDSSTHPLTPSAREGEKFIHIHSFSKENKDDFLLYILGLMNSKLYRWLITQMTNLIDEGKYAYGAKDKIEKLPIPRIDKKQEKEFAQLVKEIVQAKENGGATLVAHNERTKILESRLDSMVYKLYGLDNEEIAIIGGGGQHIV